MGIIRKGRERPRVHGRSRGWRMEKELRQKMEEAVWVACSLFARNRVTGSSANLSFLHNGSMYITASGSCFGTLTEESFAAMDLGGNLLSDKQPSKEWPLHLGIYQKKPGTKAVLHTHGIHAVLWSFVPVTDEADCIPACTPYLKMKLGRVCMVPYEQPGSQALFDAFGSRVMSGDGYLLKRHGAVVPGKDIMDAFYCMEELEENARIAWELWRAGLWGIHQKH